MDRQTRENPQTHPAKFKLAQAFVDGTSTGFLEYFKSEDEANAWIKEFSITPTEVIDWEAEIGKLPVSGPAEIFANLSECNQHIKMNPEEILFLAKLAITNEEMPLILRKKLMAGASPEEAIPEGLMRILDNIMSR